MVARSLASGRRIQYLNAKLDIYHSSAEPDLDIDCIVELSPNECIVRFDEFHSGSLSPVCWKGNAQSPGHYVLQEICREGRATLHQVPESIYLEGYWKERGYHGMWRVTLKA